MNNEILRKIFSILTKYENKYLSYTVVYINEKFENLALDEYRINTGGINLR